MYRIALIEDEVYALRALEQKILDIGGPYTIVGTAPDGERGLSLVLETNPDIVLTDIRMPHMDGIALMKKLKEHACTALRVIISGYQEFEYAKQAMRLGAEDYLLKPVDPAELSACLTRCTERIIARRREHNAVSFLMEDTKLFMHLCADHACFAVCYLLMGNALTHPSYSTHPSVPAMLPEDIESLMASQFGAQCAMHCYDAMYSNEKVLIISLPEQHAQPASIQRQLDAGIQAVTAQIGTQVTLFFSLCDQEHMIGRHIRDARKGALSNAMLGISRVCTKAPVMPFQPPNLKQKAEQITLFLRQDQPHLLRTFVQDIATAWQTEHCTMADMRTSMIFLLRLIADTLSDGFTYPSDISFLVENILCFASDHQTLAEDMCSLLLELFGPAARPRAKPSSPEDIVSHMEEYFTRNLSMNITLQMLSDEARLSKVYLCRVFRQVRDMTPMDCFTKMKIERAREMILQHADMPLREISDSLGFSDTYYFSKVFKRVMGISPSALRKA